MRTLTGTIAFLLIPSIWVGMNLAGNRMTLLWLLNDWNDWRKTNKPWSAFG